MVFGPSLPFVRCRVHSIFVLRLFNDGVAMWLLYAAVYLFLLNRCPLKLTCAGPTDFFARLPYFRTCFLHLKYLGRTCS